MTSKYAPGRRRPAISQKQPFYRCKCFLSYFRSIPTDPNGLLTFRVSSEVDRGHWPSMTIHRVSCIPLQVFQPNFGTLRGNFGLILDRVFLKRCFSSQTMVYSQNEHIIPARVISILMYIPNWPAQCVAEEVWFKSGPSQRSSRKAGLDTTLKSTFKSVRPNCSPWNSRATLL